MTGIGIDFGTTNSSVATYDAEKNRMRILTDEEQNPTYPSIVWYSDTVKVGKQAKDNYNTFINVSGNCFVKSIKTMLGKDREVSVFGEMKKPYEVSAEIFGFLKNQANDRFNIKIDQAVVTVPVYFKGIQRRELRKAASQAGIHIKTFIHEPFAAVVGYLAKMKSENIHSGLNNKYVLVFDWGGGTLDITIARIEDDKIFEVCTGGISGIAGDRFDGILKNYCINRFIDNYKMDKNRLNISPRNEDRLLAEVEKRKIELSSNEEAEVYVEYFTELNKNYVDLEQKITREKFEELIKPDMDRAMHEIDEVIRESQIDIEQIDTVLLIGGTSKIPMVANEIRKKFSYRVVEVENSETIIAEGAAVVSANNWRPYLARPIMIELSDNSYYTIFDTGAPLIPEAMEKEVEFLCIDNRENEARLIVTEEVNPVTRDKKIMDILNIPLETNLPSTKYFEKITSKFSIDNDLILNISGVGHFMGRIVRMQIYDICYGLQMYNWR